MQHVLKSSPFRPLTYFLPKINKLPPGALFYIKLDIAPRYFKLKVENYSR